MASYDRIPSDKRRHYSSSTRWPRAKTVFFDQEKHTYSTVDDTNSSRLMSSRPGMSDFSPRSTSADEVDMPPSSRTSRPGISVLAQRTSADEVDMPPSSRTSRPGINVLYSQTRSVDAVVAPPSKPSRPGMNVFVSPSERKIVSDTTNVQPRKVPRETNFGFDGSWGKSINVEPKPTSGRSAESFLIFVLVCLSFLFVLFSFKWIVLLPILLFFYFKKFA